jgi:uncharacterized membrane protein
MSLFTILLFVHVMGAIIAFGPSFAFAIIGSMGGKEPMHANFALRLTHRISHGLLWPLILLQGLTGIGLVLTIPGGIDLTKALWLDIGVVLYIFALGFSYFVQTPRLVKLIEMTSTPPPPPAPGAAPSGPPPALMALVKGSQQGGMLLGLIAVVIVFLMVTKPF